MKIYYYPQCSTCKKALKYLDEHHFSYEKIDISQNPPTQEELKIYIESYQQGIKPFFNTSGKIYREKQMKNKIQTMTLQEAVDLLSENGMLIKRPLLIQQDHVLVGFKEKEYEMLKGED